MTKPLSNITEQTASSQAFRATDLARAVLSLYGASPLPEECNRDGRLGRIYGNGRKALVLVASPDETVDVATLDKACSLRDSLMGGWDEITLLCWDVEASLEQHLLQRGDRRLDVVMIPLDLRGRLNQGGDIGRMKGRVCFVSLLRRQLSIRPVRRMQSMPDARELLVVTLDNYIPRSPDAADFARSDGSDLQALMEWGPLALIEYWAVDPAYDGQVFRPVWQCYRGDNEGRNLFPVVQQTALLLPPHSRPRRVCVRAVDVFCYASEAIVTVDAPSV